MIFTGWSNWFWYSLLDPNHFDIHGLIQLRFWYSLLDPTDFDIHWLIQITLIFTAWSKSLWYSRLDPTLYSQSEKKLLWINQRNSWVFVCEIIMWIINKFTIIRCLYLEKLYINYLWYLNSSSSVLLIENWFYFRYCQNIKVFTYIHTILISSWIIYEYSIHLIQKCISL